MDVMQWNGMNWNGMGLLLFYYCFIKDLCVEPYESFTADELIMIMMIQIVHDFGWDSMKGGINTRPILLDQFPTGVSSIVISIVNARPIFI